MHKLDDVIVHKAVYENEVDEARRQQQEFFDTMQQARIFRLGFNGTQTTFIAQLENTLNTLVVKCNKLESENIEVKKRLERLEEHTHLERF